MIYVKDLLKIKSFKNIKLITEDTGLMRRVSWPNIAQTVNIEEWLVGGDVIFITGVGLEITDGFLTSIVEQAINCDASCLIALLNDDHIKCIPQQTLDFAFKNNFPVFVAPWETKISNIIRDICMLLSDDTSNESIVNEFVENILFCNVNINNKDIQEKLISYNVNKCSQVAVAHFVNFNELRYLNEQKFRAARLSLYGKMHAELEKDLGKVLYVSKSDEVIFIFNGESKDSQKTKDTIYKLLNVTNDFLKNAQVKIGVGGYKDKFQNLSDSYIEAKRIINFIDLGSVGFYDNLGIFQLLDDVEPNKISNYIDSNIGQLITYDQKYNQDLTKTLKVFLDNNSNLVQSAKELFIHRNTIVKRIEKIEDILNVTLKDAQVRNALYNCLKILNHFNYQKTSADDT